VKKIVEYRQLPEYKEKQRQAHLGEKNYWFGRHHSEEAKKKMSISHQGKIVSEETREKMSEKHKGRFVSLETRKKLSESLKGHKLSEEHKKHLSEAHKGQISQMKGKHHSQETKDKISKSLIERFKNPEERKKISESMKGKTHICSPETRIKIGKGNKGKIRTEEFKKRLSMLAKNRKASESTKLKMSLRMKKWLSTEEGLKKVLSRRTPTSLEEKFQKIINKYNLPYKYVGDGSFIIGRKNPDFINTNNEKIAIEVYARYYKLRNNDSIDDWKEKRSKVFKSFGWETIFFDETEVSEKFILEKLK